MNTSMLDAAIHYAERLNWSVFPCDERSKEPQTVGESQQGIPYRLKWGTEATTDLNRIRVWWRQWPNANIGVACSPSRLVIIDVDVEGRPEWNRLLAKNPNLPNTPTQETPGGGLHLFYQAPSDVEIGNHDLAPGINVRGVKGKGGYIIVSPSIHPNGKRYRWIPELLPAKMQIVPLPLPLIELLVPLRQSTRLTPMSRKEHLPDRKMQYVNAVVDERIRQVRSAPVGSRNNTLNKAAFELGQLLGEGNLEQTFAEDQLRIAALAVGLSEREANATIRSGIEAGRQAPKRPSSAHNYRMSLIRDAILQQRSINHDK